MRTTSLSPRRSARTMRRRPPKPSLFTLVASTRQLKPLCEENAEHCADRASPTRRSNTITKPAHSSADIIGRTIVERRAFLKLSAGAALAVSAGTSGSRRAAAAGKDIVYLTPGLDLPFWRYLSKGIEATMKEKGFGYQALDSHNSAQNQLQNAQDSIARGVAGIIISPTDSSTAPSVLTLAKRAGIPVVIADIGTNSGDYSSFIISDNY